MKTGDRVIIRPDIEHGMLRESWISNYIGKIGIIKSMNCHSMCVDWGDNTNFMYNEDWVCKDILSDFKDSIDNDFNNLIKEL